MKNRDKKRILDLFNKSRGKNPIAGEVVVETLGRKTDDQGKSFLYNRRGIPVAIQLTEWWRRILSWAPWARNPQLLLFKSEAILVRLGENKSFIVSKDGVTEVPNEAHHKNNK